MSWRCPACHTHIRLDAGDGQRPEAGRVYRCHVCRLELHVDVATDALVIAPLNTDHQVDVRASRPRQIPTPLTARDTPPRPKKPRGYRAR